MFARYEPPGTSAGRTREYNMSERALRVWSMVWRYVFRFTVRHPHYVFIFVIVVALLVSLKLSDARHAAYENSPEGRAERARADEAIKATVAVDLAKSFVTTRLRDPSSAQFTGVRHVIKNGQEGVCGFVNARNGFGGMAGSEAFAVVDYKTMMASEGASTRRQIVDFCG